MWITQTVLPTLSVMGAGSVYCWSNLISWLIVSVTVHIPHTYVHTRTVLSVAVYIT